jgi:mannose/fructose/N-acetylgalactosamine-specific phosphotransferase system component IID
MLPSNTSTLGRPRSRFTCFPKSARTLNTVSAAMFGARPGHQALTIGLMAVMERTLSGGACWNDVSIQTVQRGLPFGGVGESGCERICQVPVGMAC